MLIVSVSAALAVVFTGAAAAGLAPKPQQPAPKEKFDPTTILVKFKTPAASAAKVQTAGDRPLGLIPGARVEVVRLQAGETVKAKLAEYRAREDVLFAEPNYVLQPDAVPTLTPNDPMFDSQWSLTNIAADAGWAIFPGSFPSAGGPKIAIVDTGVYAGHPDLTGKVLTSEGAGCLGSGFICSSGFASTDDFGHGTHAAGIAGGVANNGTGIAGVALSSPLIPIKVCFGTVVGNGCPLASIASGIAWAVAKGAGVINISLGGPSAGTMCAAATAAIAKGVTVVAAAGNDSTNAPTYPAACPGVIGVSANGNNSDSAWYGNWDYPNVFVSAPGGTTASNSPFDPFPPTPGDPSLQILSTVPFHEDGTPGLYESLMGTSMASPFVAGLAALMKGERPLRTPTDVRRVLAKTADKVLSPGFGDYGVPYGAYTPRGSDPFRICAVGGCTWHPFWGYGQINIATALRGAAPKLLSFTPSAGPVGTVVTLSGEDLGGATEVSFGVPPTAAVTTTGRTSTIIATPSENSIKLAVPDGGVTGQISVKTPGGVSTSAGVFKVSPKITGFEPASAKRGDTVTVQGKNFGGATALKVGSVTASGLVVAPDGQSLTFTVPPTAVTGKISVTTPAGTGTSVANLVVILPPTISGFTPTSGGGGATVNITGTNLGTVTDVVFGGDANAAFTAAATSIQAVVPDSAQTGAIIVKSPGGVATSTGVFTVDYRISGFSPESGGVGELITISGTGMGNTSLVEFNGIPTLPILRMPTSVTARIPPGATDGPITVKSLSGASSTSSTNFQVIGVMGFTPSFAPAGASVKIRVRGLQNPTHVLFNGWHAPPITVNPDKTEITASIPFGATTGPVTVWDEQSSGLKTYMSSTDFEVLTITGLSPSSGTVGTSVTISGSGFTGATAVKFGGANAAFTVNSAGTQVTATVPGLALSGRVVVETPRGNAEMGPGAPNFAVSPTITSFSPQSGPVGTEVHIVGTGFADTVGVFFSFASASFTVNLTATKLTAIVPSGVATGSIRVANNGGTDAETPATTPFTVTPPP